MPRAKEFSGLAHQLLEARNVLVRDLDRLFALAYQVQHMRERLTSGSNLHLTINGTGDERRIHQRSQRYRLEFHGAAILPCWREGRAELPSSRQPHARCYSDRVRACAF